MLRTLLISALLLAGSAGAGAAPAQPAAEEAVVVELRALRAEVQRAEGALQPLYARRTKLSAEAARLAASIDELKGKSAGVRRDLDLEAALAASKSKTDELERVQAELRWREPGLTALRRRLVHAIDVALDAHAALPEATRLELGRVRTATVALLVGPAQPLQVARDKDAAVADPLDGPRELREKADLLRDSGDKLRREARRIAGRLDGVERRRRLRERAGALDEDMFGEATSSRRITRTGNSDNTQTVNSETRGNSDAKAGSPSAPGSAPPPPAVPNTGAAAEPSPADGANNGHFQNSGGTTSTPVPGPPRTEATVLRNLVDPATLEELRRADAIDDIDRQTRALKKAQAELESLAAELDRRAQALDGRAEEIKRRK